MSFASIIEKVIFRPAKLAPDHVFKFDQNFEELFFHTDKDVRINALHFKANESKGFILYFHGNKDNLLRWGEIASGLLKFNYDVVVMDYRGYGKSTGERTEENLYADALFCFNEIRQKYDPREIVLYGRSLGTGIASWLAGKVNTSRLILETPYYDMHDLLADYIPRFLYKDSLNYKFRSFEWLQKTNFPILIIHGTKDEVVPYKSGIKLYESINNIHKSFFTIKGGRHNDLHKFDKYWKKLNDFL